jgi:hypothetical protein
VTRGTTNDRTQPRQEFFHSERLREVIVGAGIDAVDPFGPTAARCQDEDRGSASVCPPPLEHGEPIHPWQAEVEHYRSVILGIAAKPRLLTVAHGFDHIPGGLERSRYIRRDPSVILDQKHAHHFSLMRRISLVRAST